MKKRIDTKAYQKRMIKRISNRCLKLWKECIKLRAENRCEAPGCKETKKLNAHHIEDYILNPYLRYEESNGLCLCPSNHKFGVKSAHRSFLFMLEMQDKFPDRFAALHVAAIKAKQNPPVMDYKYFVGIERNLLNLKRVYTAMNKLYK